MLLLIALLALLLGGHALALEGRDDGFTGTVPLPDFVPELAATTARRAMKAASTTQADGEPVEALTILTPTRTGKYFTEDTVWTANVTGGSGEYEFVCYLVTKYDEAVGLIRENMNTHAYWRRSASDRFAYRLVVPGIYYLILYAYDTSAQDDAGEYLSDIKAYKYTVAADSEARITAAQKVEQVVGECLDALGEEASDFDRALWLHDWITANAHYSQDTHYYSEDGVLIRGDGVCDSYCKAYRMLLNAAEIECDRIFGTAVSSRVNHAWNRAKLDGEWFQIDVTWDDPSGGVLPVSGLERHLYFGLTDDMMTVDHAYEIPEGFECTSLAQNYFVKTGRAEYWAADVRAAIREIVLTGDATRSFPIPTGNYRDERGRSISLTYIPYGAVLWQLRAWDVQYVDTARGVVEAGFTVEQTGIDDVPMVYLDSVAGSVDALRLPAALAALEAEAFAGGGSQVVVLPEGVTEIPDRAFADCADLVCVFVPASVETIASNALEGSARAVITCPRDSAAHAAALANGLPFTLY